MNNDLFQNTVEEIRPGLQKLQSLAMAMLVIGVLASVGGFILQGADKFYQSWLTSYVYWFGVTAGCIGLLFLHHTVGGGWGFIIRRMLEAASRCLPLMFVLFIPVILGMHNLYEWSRPEVVAGDAILQAKAKFLNPAFFIGRWVFYFAVWGVFVFFLNKWSAIFDTRNDEKAFSLSTRVAAFGILCHCLLVTFMVVDWVMSITPHWVSSVLGLLFVVGQGLAAISLMNVFIGTLGIQSSLLKIVPQRYFRDLGNLTLAMVLAWAYLSFSQYLIQYAGNIAEEVEWYVVRRHGGWGIIGLFLVFLHFALPFLALLSSSLKVYPRNMWKLAAFLLVMRWIDLLYLTRPNYQANLIEGLHIADIGTFCLMGGAWLFLWSREVQRRPLVPRYDPRFALNWAILEHHHEHAPEGYDDADDEHAPGEPSGIPQPEVTA